MCPDKSITGPRNGRKYVVAIVARISGGQYQTELSIDDQVDHGKRIAYRLYGDDAAIEFREIRSINKGERLDRPELAEIDAMIRSRTLDLLVAEDLGRMVRGVDAIKICGVACDHETRVISPHDGIDTEEEGWETRAINACGVHVSHNAHNSKRLKFKLANRLEKFDGAAARPVYGYHVPHKGATYNEWQKVVEATPVYLEWFERLRIGRNYSAVADWLKATGIPTGPFNRSGEWDSATVARVTRNPILKGVVCRGWTITIKHHETGRWVKVENPDGPACKEFPHLAHVPAAVFDEVNAMLREANKGLGRKKKDGRDPLKGVPRKRTRFPGQHALCWYCGRPYLWGGNGIKDTMMCKGAKVKECWNSFSVKGPMLARYCAEQIATLLEQLDGIDDLYRRLLEEADRGGESQLGRDLAEVRRREAVNQKERANIANAIASVGMNEVLKDKLSQLEEERVTIRMKQQGLEHRLSQRRDLPGSIEEVRSLIREKLSRLATDSPDCGDLLRLLVPELFVYRVRLIDGGHPYARARARINLSGVVPDADRVPGLPDLLTTVVTFDVDAPPQREQIRVQAVALEAEGLGQRQIAERLGATQAAVFNALQLDRLMKERGLDTPYEFVAEPPADYTKLRTIHHGRFRFKPLEGYQPPAL